MGAALGLGIAVVGYLTVGSQRTETHTQQITRAVSALDVTGGGGDVEVVASQGSTVTVTETLHYGIGRKPETTRAVENGQLRLAYQCGGGWMPFGGCEVDYRVEVPANLGLRIEAGSGDVTVRNVNGRLDLQAGSGDVNVINAGGPARVSAGSGDIDVDGVRGDLSLETGSGSVEADGIQAKTVIAKAGSGDLDLVFAGPPGSVTAETGSGDAQLELPAGSYNVTADSDSGEEDVEVASDPGAPNTVDVHAGSGDVQVDSG